MLLDEAILIIRTMLDIIKEQEMTQYMMSEEQIKATERLCEACEACEF